MARVAPFWMPSDLRVRCDVSSKGDEIRGLGRHSYSGQPTGLVLAEKTSLVYGTIFDPDGEIQIVVFDVTSNSAKVRWKRQKKSGRPSGIFYSSKYIGADTIWNGAPVNDDEASAVLKNLEPKHEYVVKIVQDHAWEITVIQTREDTSLRLPQLKPIARSANNITLKWSDFDSDKKYTIEYRKNNAGLFDQWTKVKASGSFGTIKDLDPGNGYLIRVRNQEDFVSDSLLAFTEDGCVRQGKSYRVGDTFFEGCSLRCVCRGNDQSACEPRCPASFFGSLGSAIASPSRCHQVPSESDSCCVSMHCEHGKPGKCPSTEYN
ncbi:putative epidermal cell surface receptor-like, partial [Tropilaelaps mercedesae]